MKPTEFQCRQPEDVLKDVYLAVGASKPASINSQWKANVLRHIHLIRREMVGQLSPIDLFNQAVWRLAPVAGGLVLIIAVWLYNHGLNPDLDIASLALNNPERFSLFEMFGM